MTRLALATICTASAGLEASFEGNISLNEVP
jgi:hypothetical protein